MEAIKKDYRDAPLSAAERAMLDFVVRLTRNPGGMMRGHLSPLKEAGFDDLAILEIVHITSFFNYINRVADGLGVDPEPDWLAEPSEQGNEDDVRDTEID